MSFNGVLVFVISLAVLIAFLPSIKNFCLEGVREWQETDEEEKKQMTCFALLFLVAGIAYLVWRFF